MNFIVSALALFISVFISTGQQFVFSNLTFPISPAQSSHVELTEATTSFSEGLGGTAIVSYPKGWIAQTEFGNIFLSNNEDGMAALQADEDGLVDFSSGTIGMGISVFPLEIVAVIDEMTPKSFIETFKSFASSGENMPEFGDTQELTIGGNPAAQTSGSNDKADSSLIAIQKGNAYVMVLAVAPKGELAGHQAIIQDIAASAEFVASAE